MLQIQGVVATAKARARVYKDYTQSRTNTEDEAEYDEVIVGKCVNRRQKLTTATEELDKMT